jgi:hypothetical protein
MDYSLNSMAVNWGISLCFADRHSFAVAGNS